MKSLKLELDLFYFLRVLQIADCTAAAQTGFSLISFGILARSPVKSPKIF